MRLTHITDAAQLIACKKQHSGNLHAHTRLTVNAVLKDLLKKGGSRLNKTNLLFLDEQKK